MSANADITCREVVELLSSYLDDELPASERARVDAHLATCAGCTMVLDELRETIRLTGGLTEDRLSETQAATLLDAFRGWAGGA